MLPGSSNSDSGQSRCFGDQSFDLVENGSLNSRPIVLLFNDSPAVPGDFTSEGFLLMEV